MSNVVGLFAKFAPGATARPASPRSPLATLNPSGVPGGRGDAVPACIPAIPVGVAQQEERVPSKHDVGGSTPPADTRRSDRSVIRRASVPAFIAPPAERMAADVGASAGPATPIAGPAQPLNANDRGNA